MDKMETLLNTFWKNRGRALAEFLISEAIAKDEKDLAELREKTKDLYENAAKRYYNEHGTNGEF